MATGTSGCRVPELPEVETVVRDLRPLLTGRRIATAWASRKALRKRWSPAWEPPLLGRQIQAVRRRGKWIVLDLDRDAHLVFHLGMSGQLTVVAAGEPRAGHTHVVIGFDEGDQQLRLRDPRRFGSAVFYPDTASLDRFFTKTNLGPEPFALDAKYFRHKLAGAKRSLKAILLDQRVAAGVGNIYADESLFQARLHPAQLGQDTTAAEADRLRRAIVTVLNRAIARRGSSIRDYVGGDGLQGGYQREFRVYGRDGQACPRCRTVIQSIRLASRSTHFCPNCQPRNHRGTGHTKKTDDSNHENTKERKGEKGNKNNSKRKRRKKAGGF
jgi:formamidopyrimidine-DNA glycosylase